MKWLNAKKLDKVSVLCIIICLLTSILIVFIAYTLSNSTVKAHPISLTVSIRPEEIVKLGVGQHQIFTATVENGVEPYSFVWKSNGTIIGSDQTLDFVFEEACSFAILSVNVLDNEGNPGYASTVVFDPFVARDIYIDDIPVTTDFVIRYDDVAYYWATRSDGYISSNDTVLTVVQASVVSDLTSNGGSIHLAEVEWDSGTSIPSNILVIQDYQGKRSYYTSQNIDFNQAQLEEGVFHAGGTPPSGPTTGQWFYDTDDYTLYIYNGTAWDITGSGATGPAGTLEGEQPYAYLVFKNATSTYMINGTTGSIDWNSSDDDVLINAATGNLTSGRTWKEKVIVIGSFTIDAPIIYERYTYLDFNQARFYLANNSDCYMLQNANPSTYDNFVWIDGGYFDCNGGNQASGGGIYWSKQVSEGGATLTQSKIIGTCIDNAKDYGILLDGKSGLSFVVDMTDITVDSRDVGVYLNNTNDVRIVGGLIGGWGGSLHVNMGSTNLVQNCYLNYDVTIFKSTNFNMDHCFIDISENTHGILIQGSTLGNYDNLTVDRVSNSTYNSKSAIRMEGTGGEHCTDNIFNSITFRKIFKYTDQWAYGVEEADSSQNYNAFGVLSGRKGAAGGSNIYSIGTASLRILGANSTHVAELVIGTVAIT